MVRADEIVNIIYTQYFKTLKKKYNQDPKFLDRVNSAFVCLVATTFYFHIHITLHSPSGMKGEPEMETDLTCSITWALLAGVKYI